MDVFEANYSDIVSSWLAHFKHEPPSTDTALLTKEVGEPATPTESVANELPFKRTRSMSPLLNERQNERTERAGISKGKEGRLLRLRKAFHRGI